MEPPQRVPLRKKSSFSSAPNHHTHFNPEGEVRVACEILSLAFVTVRDEEDEGEGEIDEEAINVLWVG